MINKNTIGKIIKQLRIQNKLTQEELSEKVNISTNYLSKIERGLCILNTETFLKMAEVLSFSLKDFGINCKIQADSDKEKLIQRILLSSSKETKAFSRLLDTMNAIIKDLK